MAYRTPYGTPKRRGRLTTILAVALLVVPTLEIAIIIAVGRQIGGWLTLGLLIAESALGAWLVRREGGRAWRALSQALRSGRMPAGELSDAALVLVGGTLLLTPGFLTDIVGFFFVIPFTRPIARRALTRLIERRLLGGGPGMGGPLGGPFGGAGGPFGGAGGPPGGSFGDQEPEGPPFGHGRTERL